MHKKHQNELQYVEIYHANIQYGILYSLKKSDASLQL